MSDTNTLDVFFESLVTPSTNRDLDSKKEAFTSSKNVPEDISMLLDALALLCEEFSEKVLTSRSISCVAAHYAKLRGSAVVRALTPYAQSSRRANYRVGKVFREGIAKVTAESALMSQALQKPYGYPGDFSLLESIYQGTASPNTVSAVGQSIDLWTIGTGLARAVIDRKNALRMFIEDFATTYKASSSRARVLSIASGAARELRELPLDALANLDVTLLDVDLRGMYFAKAFFNSRHIPLYIETIVADVLSDETGKLFHDKAPYDLIYSFGLYDYLSDNDILKSIALSKRVLNNNGRFVFCLKDTRYYDSWFYDWGANWRFYPRTAEDGFVLAEKAGLNVEETYTIENRVVTIYICKPVSTT